MLRFRDPNRIVVEKSKVKIGTKVKITVASTETQTPEKLISAEVTSLEAEIGSPGSFTIIRGYDPAHRLFRGRHTKSYTQITASDAVSQVAQRADLPTGQIDVQQDRFRPPRAVRSNRLGVPRRDRQAHRVRVHGARE